MAEQTRDEFNAITDAYLAGVPLRYLPPLRAPTYSIVYDYAPNDDADDDTTDIYWPDTAG